MTVNTCQRINGQYTSVKIPSIVGVWKHVGETDGRTHCRRGGNQMEESERNSRHGRVVGTTYQQKAIRKWMILSGRYAICWPQLSAVFKVPPRPSVWYCHTVYCATPVSCLTTFSPELPRGNYSYLTSNTGFIFCSNSVAKDWGTSFHVLADHGSPAV
jgi:hypothetical protein